MQAGTVKEQNNISILFRVVVVHDRHNHVATTTQMTRYQQTDVDTGSSVKLTTKYPQP